MSSMTRAGGWLELKLKYDLGSDYVAPSCVLRGSLFSSETFRGVKRPQEAQGEVAVSNGKLSITRMRGLQLDQYDLEVLCVVIKLSAKLNAEHDQVKLTIKRETMLHELNWTHGGAQCKRLERSFEKLSNQKWLLHIDDEYSDINEEIELVKAEQCGTAYNVTLNTVVAGRKLTIYRSEFRLKFDQGV